MDITAPFHVLLIEDSPEDRADIRQMLLRGSQRHYKFTEAETGDAGVRALLDHPGNPPDCVLLDFKLPDMDAFEVLAAIRGGGDLTVCPVVVVTGTMQSGAQVIRAGAQDYVGKDWATPESLTRAVENAVERYALANERLRHDAALRESRHFLQRLTEVAPGVLHVYDLEKQSFVYVSQAVASVIGYRAEEITAMGRDDLAALMHPEDLPRFAGHLQRVRTLGDGEKADFEFRVRAKSGEWRWFQNRDAVFARDAEGVVHQTIGAALDITERKLAEEANRLVTARFELALKDSAILVCYQDLELRHTWIYNPALGFEAHQVIGKRDRDLMERAEDAAVTEAIKREVIRSGVGRRQEVLVRAQGVNRYYDLQVEPLRDADDRITGVQCAAVDITERAQAEEAVKLNAALFAKIIEQAPGGVYVLDAQLRVREMNTEALPVFASVQPVIGRELGEVLETLWGPELGRECTAIVRRTLETGERYVSPRFDHRRHDIGVEQVYDWETQRLTLPDGQHGVVCYFQDVTARERAAAALRTSEAHMRLAAEATGVGIWEWNVLTNRVRWDAQMFRLYGIAPTPDGLVPYQTWAGAVLPEDLAANEAILQETVRRLGRSTRTFRIGRANDGECRHIEAVEIVRTNAQGQAEWVLGTNLDVTERKRAEEALRAEVAERKQAEEQVRLLNRDLEQHVADRVVELATKARLLAERNAEVELARNALEEKAAELARASGYKSEFLANMSHELRTPLNVILLLSQQLAENKPGNLSAKQREFAHLVHSSGTDLLNLINDILDLAKIESGTVTVKVEEVSLARLCDSLTRHFQPVADAKKLTLHASLADDLPPGMHSDTQRVRQILKNLIANALKFTARGRVEVRVGLAKQGWPPDHPVLGQAPQVIAFAVEDTGIGIAPEQRERIFESFQQADATTSRHHGGTGLGLAISRELAALLGGAINLTSAPGRGSTFTLYLPQKFVGPDRTGDAGDRKIIVEIVPRSEPLADHPDIARPRSVSPFPKESPEERTRTDGPREILRGRKVLVVDDDVRNIYALTALLENHELETLSATDGRSAIRLLENTPDVDLVLMDIMMPDMDGYETMRELRRSPQFRTLPILALTAHAMPGDREKCLEAGASDYLTKPVNSEQLIAVMSDWMAR